MPKFNATEGAPGWWFGAPLFGVLFGFIADRFFPEFVQKAAGVVYWLSGNGQPSAPPSPDVTRFLAPLIGIVLAVLVLGAWRLARHLTLRREPS